MKLEDYIRDELEERHRVGVHSLSGRCPLLEDEVDVKAWEYILYLEDTISKLDGELVVD